MASNNNVKKNEQASSKILITSALPYVNNVPHLGNIIGCVLSADVYARFSRSMGRDTLFICGTDEHGTTSETKAIEEGVTPKEICDKYFKIHKKIYEWFNCSFDEFGRTSSKANHDITKDIFEKLDKNGYILEDELEQMFCNKCSRYLADRFIEGTCPHCGYEKARGDQCDNCGKLLNPTDLIDAKCKICNSKPDVKRVKHLFMDLPKIAPKLQKWIESREKDWSDNSRKMTSAWLRDGLRPRCITRDLKWGVSVPKKGYEDKVFYSWFDAPIGYIGITINKFKNWSDWWKNDENVKLVQFMGKDNIPFHTIMFPSFLIGADDDYTLLNNMSSTEYLNYESGKFSKSNKSGVFGDDAMSTGIDSDVFRYYLLSNRPETSDTEFSWQDFLEKNNSELLANLGNFVNRALTFLGRAFDNNIPNYNIDTISESDKSFLSEIDTEIKKYIELMDEIKLRDGLKQIMHISRLGNQYFQENEPWKLAKEDITRCGQVLYVCCELVRKLAIIVEPYLPETSNKMFAQLNISKQKLFDLDKSIIRDKKIGTISTLFRKLDQKEIDSFREQFVGTQDERKTKLDKKSDKQKSEKINSNNNISKENLTDNEKFSKINLKVAKILDIKNHPQADKLYILQIDLGYEKRQLVAGLRPYLKEDELLGKKIVIVSNLKPAKLRGEISQGMLLAADAKDESGKEIVKTLEPINSDLGSQVYVDGIVPGESRIEIDDFFEIKLTTKDQKVLFNGKTLRTDKEEIGVDISDNAKIR
jgi:methionyl-tRNA synthetase